MNVKSICISCLLALTPFVSHAMSIHDYAQVGWANGVEECINQDPSLLDAKDRNGKTPLFWATFNGHTNVVTMLLNKRANPNIADNDMETPLHWAAFNDDPTITSLLLQNKADIHAKDNNGETPIDRAYHSPRSLHILQATLKLPILTTMLCGHQARCGARSPLMAIDPATLQYICKLI